MAMPVAVPQPRMPDNSNTMSFTRCSPAGLAVPENLAALAGLADPEDQSAPAAPPDPVDRAVPRDRPVLAGRIRPLSRLPARR